MNRNDAYSPVPQRSVFVPNYSIIGTDFDPQFSSDSDIGHVRTVLCPINRFCNKTIEIGFDRKPVI